MSSRKIIVLLFISNIFFINLFGQIKIPTSPTVKDPSISFPEKKEAVNKSYTVKADVFKNLKTRISGELKFYVESIEINHLHEGQHYKKTLKLSEIISIDILEWEKTATGKNSFSFYPVKYKIELNNNSLLEVTHNIKAFNSILFKNQMGTSRIYTYFIDYWENNQWKIIGTKDKNYPKTNPNSAVVRKIILHSK